MNKLTHLDQDGNATMVDVSEKDITERIAVAAARIDMQPETLAMILRGEHKKGDVLTVAKIAGIQAAKQCSSLIPLCHPLMLTAIDVVLTPNETKNCIHIQSSCKLNGQTGVEMEALTAATIAALTLYDMCKAVDRGMVIRDVRLIKKSGGNSGDFETTS